MFDLLIAPFNEFAFMRRALAGVVALALAGAPMGVLLMLRRMSLTGDGMSHAILPGAAIAYAVSGMALWPLTLGGLAAGLVVALAAGALSRFTALKEDASLASFYLISLALGVVIIAGTGAQVDVMHFLFGSILALDEPTLQLVAIIASVTLVTLALIWRPLVLDGIDPGFLRTVSRAGAPAYMIFMALLVLNLVAGFHALGTLLAVGFIVLPSVIARFWTRDLNLMLAIAAGSSLLCGVSGLLLSYHLSLPTGPTMILTLGVAFAGSILLGPVEGVLAQFRPGPHRTG
jgi:zinc/manganese transport system permease protein